MRLSLAVSALAVVATPLASSATSQTWRVGDERQFARAVTALRDSGGTIVLLPHVYRGELVVGARSRHPLRLLGRPGVRVERLLLDRTQRVSVERLTIAPATQDAWVKVTRSRDVELDGIVVTGLRTRFSASVLLPDSDRVTIRRSVFTHCGDRSPAFANCLLLGRRSNRLTVEDSWFHDCYGCDFVHGRFGSGLVFRRNRLERALPCSIGRVRCMHQDLIELFAGRYLRFEANRFGVYRLGGAQLYLTGEIEHVLIANNLFLGTDPRVPGYRSRVGLIVGSAGAADLPRFVTVANNTILTGARRTDGYLGSLRMTSRYGSVPRRARPVLANNIIGVLEAPRFVCSEARASVRNVVLRGFGCSGSDRVGDAKLDTHARPTAASALVIDAGSIRHGSRTDITGRRRRHAPDIGAYEYRR